MSWNGAMPGDAPASGNKLLGIPASASPDAALLSPNAPQGMAANRLFQQSAQAPRPPQAGPMLSGAQPSSQMAQAEQLINRMGLTPQQISDEMQRSEALFHLLAPIVRSDKDVTSKSVINAVGSAVASKSFTVPEAASFLAKIPDTNAPSGGTDGRVASQLRGMLSQQMRAALMVNAHLGGIANALGPALPPPTGSEQDDT